MTFTANHPTALNYWIIVKSTLIYIRVIGYCSIIKKRLQLSPLIFKLLPTFLIFFFLNIRD